MQKDRTEPHFYGGTPQSILHSPYVNQLNNDIPILLCDIDHTIMRVSGVGSYIVPNTKILPLSDSQRVLFRLSNIFQIFYLTARSFWQIPKTLKWLHRYEFPPAPVIYRDCLPIFTPSVQYKINAIEKLKVKFNNIPWGIGDRYDDTIAYARNHIRSIHIDYHGFSSVYTYEDKNTIQVINWNEIESIFF